MYGTWAPVVVFYVQMEGERAQKKNCVTAVQTALAVWAAGRRLKGCSGSRVSVAQAAEARARVVELSASKTREKIECTQTYGLCAYLGKCCVLIAISAGPS